MITIKIKKNKKNILKNCTIFAFFFSIYYSKKKKLISEENLQIATVKLLDNRKR